jgi:hypothetical protein
VRRTFTVTFEVPDGATLRDCMKYIYDAVSTWRGQCRPPDDDDPGDPMHGLDWKTVSVDTLQSEQKH